MLVQMNCRMSESAAQRLKDRARLTGKTIGAVIEALLDSNPSNDSNPINDSNPSNDSSLSAIEARLSVLEVAESDKVTRIVDCVVDAVRHELIGVVAADFARIEARLVALEAVGSRGIAGQGSYPTSAASDAGVSRPAAPSVAGTSVRDSTIIELRKQNLKFREIQDELWRRGIFAKGRDGQAKPISSSVISNVIAAAGLSDGAVLEAS